MTGHLSAKRVAEAVAAGSTPDEEQHLRECAQCGAEAARLESALGGFRETMHAWSGEEGQVALRKGQSTQWAARRGPSRVWLRWPMLTAAVLVLSVAPVYKTVRDHLRAAQALADAQLMEQVDREVSEAVPAPMEPLAQLVSWGPTQQDRSQTNPQGSSLKGDVR
jgi:hypothetical protein